MADPLTPERRQAIEERLEHWHHMDGQLQGRHGEGFAMSFELDLYCLLSELDMTTRERDNLQQRKNDLQRQVERLTEHAFGWEREAREASAVATHAEEQIDRLARALHQQPDQDDTVPRLLDLLAERGFVVHLKADGLRPPERRYNVFEATQPARTAGEFSTAAAAMKNAWRVLTRNEKRAGDATPPPAT